MRETLHGHPVVMRTFTAIASLNLTQSAMFFVPVNSLYRYLPPIRSFLRLWFNRNCHTFRKVGGNGQFVGREFPVTLLPHAQPHSSQTASTRLRWSLPNIGQPFRREVLDFRGVRAGTGARDHWGGIRVDVFENLGKAPTPR